MNKILEFNLQDDIKIYLHHSIPLSILSLDKNYEPWLNEHFKQIYCHIDSDNNFRIDYKDHFRDYREVMDIHEICYTKAAYIENITDFIINAINKDYYVSVFVDEFYLKNRGAYGYFHYTRQLVVYGYDLQSRIFNCLGYTKLADSNVKDSGYDIFASEEIPFYDFKISYAEAKRHFKGPDHQYLVLLARKNDPIDYKFNLSGFLNKLERFIYSRGYNEGQLSIGFNVYNSLLDSLKGIINDQLIKVDARTFYILHEHKKTILKTLEYVFKEYNLPTEPFKSIIDHYNQRIVQRSKIIFYQFLKIEYKLVKNKQWDDNDQLIPISKENWEKQINDIKNIIKALGTFSMEEQSITLQLLVELKKHCKTYINN
jgi:hypothetical protein